MKLSNSLFQLNRAAEGGALYATNSVGTSITLTASRFLSNTASSGGAVFVSGFDFAASRLLLQGNSASDVGGAIYLEVDNQAQLSNSRFLENRSFNEGGAIFFGSFGLGFSEVTRSQFNDNSSFTGGALRNDSPVPVVLSVLRFLNNSAASDPSTSGLFTVS